MLKIKSRHLTWGGPYTFGPKHALTPYCNQQWH